MLGSLRESERNPSKVCDRVLIHSGRRAEHHRLSNAYHESDRVLIIALVGGQIGKSWRY
jgi:hypothetical protein